jgi:hypothetical protein
MSQQSRTRRRQKSKAEEYPCLTRRNDISLSGHSRITLEADDVVDADELLAIDQIRRERDARLLREARLHMRERLRNRMIWEKVKGEMDEALYRRQKKERAERRRALQRNRLMYGKKD